MPFELAHRASPKATVSHDRTSIALSAACCRNDCEEDSNAYIIHGSTH
jgi:hypothetical protein